VEFLSDVNDLVTRLTELGIPSHEANFFIASAITIGKGPEAIILYLLKHYEIEAAASAPVVADAILLGKRAQRAVETKVHDLPNPPRRNGSGMREDQHA
jgi:hypothetical protein